MENYLKKLREILDEASGDSSLSTKEYADLCAEIAEDAQSRAEASYNDIEEQEEG